MSIIIVLESINDSEKLFEKRLPPMKIRDIYTSCLNVEPQAQFIIYFEENQGNILNHKNGVKYENFEYLPYGFYALREVVRFEVCDDGYTVHVELKAEG